MEEAVLHVGRVVAPVVICALVGFGIAKAGAPFDRKMVRYVLANVGYPALVLGHLAGQHVALGALLQVMLAGFIAVGCFGVAGFLFLKVMGLPQRALLSPMMVNNTGNIGLPVSLLAFGDAGLAYALAVSVVSMLVAFTIGVWLPRGRVSLRELLLNPVIYAVAISLVLLGTGTRLPPVLDSSFDILGGMTIPLMLLTLGHTLAGLKVELLWRGCYLSLFHLVMAAGVAFGLVHLFAFDGAMRGTFILQCVMPASLATYLWVEMYRPEQAANAASFIFVSTLLSIVVLPIVLTIWI